MYCGKSFDSILELVGIEKLMIPTKQYIPKIGIDKHKIKYSVINVVTFGSIFFYVSSFHD